MPDHPLLRNRNTNCNWTGNLVMKNCLFFVCIALVVLAGQGMSAGQSGSQKTGPMASPSPAGPTRSTSVSRNEPQFQTRDVRYKIAPGDSFEIIFDLSPEFNQTGVSV